MAFAIGPNGRQHNNISLSGHVCQYVSLWVLSSPVVSKFGIQSQAVTSVCVFDSHKY